MSFVWKADHPLRSEEDIARQVHEVALARGLDDLATVLALMCIRQESNFWCPWNRKDPSSEKYDHDSESDDGRSVGYFQQQNGRPGEVLPPGDRDNWWGDMASRMDLKRSTDTFLSRLSDNYTSVTNGAQAAIFIQRVQRSKYPDAYAKHWDYCWALLRRAQAQGPIAPVPPADPVPVPVTVMRPDFDERQMYGTAASPRSRKPINFFIHTQEGSWDATAKDLAVFCQGQNQVSYHYTIRDGIVYDVVDTDLYCWAVLNANVFSINLCFAGSSVTQTREQWLQRYGRDIEIAAYLAVQDARKYGFSTEVIPPPYDGNARPGVSDHKYVTQKLGIGTHVDVGDNFPWDVFAAHVNKFANGQENWAPVLNQLTGGSNAMASADDVQHKLVDDGDKITVYEGADWPGGELHTGDARTWWNRLTWDLLRVQDGVDQDKNGDGKSTKLGLRDSVRRLVFEATLWTPRLPLAELIAKRTNRDTIHGHARDAASYGDVTVRILRRLADKAGVDISDLLQ